MHWRDLGGVRVAEATQFIQVTGGPESRQFRRIRVCRRAAREVTLPQQVGEAWLTLMNGNNTVEWMAKSVSKIQIGQLWKKDGTSDTYLVTRVYSEVLSTMATLRKSGSETEALVRVKVERTAEGQTLVGFSPAQEHEKF